jgi:MFS family permease
MTMFGAIFFLPVFVQGVIGNSATNSGEILIPMLLAMVASSIASGQLISRTGRYKVPILAGLAVMAVGYFMVANFDISTSNETLIEAMILIGLGLGVTMQTYTLVVQNSVSRADMAVATSATQLSRSMGSALGLAIMGTILTQGMASSIAKYIPADVLQKFQSSGHSATAGAVFDPTQLANLPPVLAAGIRHGLSDALHPVFVAGLAMILVAFIATLFIPEVPLRQTAHVVAGRSKAESPKESETAV